MDLARIGDPCTNNDGEQEVAGGGERMDEAVWLVSVVEPATFLWFVTLVTGWLISVATAAW